MYILQRFWMFYLCFSMSNSKQKIKFSALIKTGLHLQKEVICLKRSIYSSSKHNLLINKIMNSWISIHYFIISVFLHSQNENNIYFYLCSNLFVMGMNFIFFQILFSEENLKYQNVFWNEIQLLYFVES